MQKRNWIIPGAAMILLAASLIVFPSSASDKKKTSPSTCCKKSMKQCCGDTRDKAPGEMIMENLSHQFISVSFFTH